jgi:hypothetical protein
MATMVVRREVHPKPKPNPNWQGKKNLENSKVDPH